MARTTATDTIRIKKRELKAMLREVVREELERFATQTEDWQFDTESPLYQALDEIREDAKAGRIKLLTHEQVWGK